MIAKLDAKFNLHAPICRLTWGRLYYFLRSVDPQGSGQVTISHPEILEFFGVDSSTLYRWLKDGRRDGAFRYYMRQGGLFTICLGSKRAIAFNLGLTDWGAATRIDRSELAAANWRDLVTAHQTYWQQRRSETAALKSARRGKIKKPRVAKIKLALRRATAAKPTLLFLRNKIPYGTSQTGIGKGLNLTDRTVRRHLKPVLRVQQVHKIPYQEGWAEIQIAKEDGRKPNCFIRGNEAFKFGCNIYDLEFEQRSERTQRVKYLYFLCKILRRRGVDLNKSDLSFDPLYGQIAGLWSGSFAGDLNLDDFIKLRSFDTFRKNLSAGLRLRHKREKLNK